MALSNRSEIALESSVLMRRATWCGIVFALAMILTALNFMPPIRVEYHVHSKVVVSETRLMQLRKLAVADRQAVQRGERSRIQLMSVKVLDLAEQPESVGSQPNADKVVLIEVGTLWRHRCTPERHFTWLSNISKVDPSQLSTAQAAQESRFARWNLQAAKHYHSQHLYLSDKQPLLDELPPSDVAANQASRGFQLASYRHPTSADEAASATQPAHHLATSAYQPDAQQQGTNEQSNPNDVELQLKDQIQLAEDQLKRANEQLVTERDRMSGTLQIAGLPLIAPRSTSIPFWMAASILILGLATGSTAGWFHFRAQSGGIHDPVQVAEQLALDNIPIAGFLVLQDFNTSPTASGQLIRNGGRRMGRISEWILSGWIVIALTRFFFDSIWRDVLVHSPLAALGRMLTGMP